MNLNPGDSVEVNQVWAAGGPLRPPLRQWFKGYTLDRVEGDTAYVRHQAGLYEGMTVAFPLSDVRHARQYWIVDASNPEVQAFLRGEQSCCPVWITRSSAEWTRRTILAFLTLVPEKLMGLEVTPDSVTEIRP